MSSGEPSQTTNNHGQEPSAVLREEPDPPVATTSAGILPVATQGDAVRHNEPLATAGKLQHPSAGHRLHSKAATQALQRILCSHDAEIARIAVMKKRRANRIIFAMHALRCPHGVTTGETLSKCKHSWCPTVKALLVHMRACSRGSRCAHKHCWSMKQVLRHFANCSDRNACRQCAPTVQCLNILGSSQVAEGLAVVAAAFRQKTPGFGEGQTHRPVETESHDHSHIRSHGAVVDTSTSDRAIVVALKSAAETAASQALEIERLQSALAEALEQKRRKTTAKRSCPDAAQKGAATVPTQKKGRFDTCPAGQGDAVAQLTCVVCLDRPRSIVFRPCAHLAVCHACATRCQSSCPVCRSTISKAEPVFLP